MQMVANERIMLCILLPKWILSVYGGKGVEHHHSCLQEKQVYYSKDLHFVPQPQHVQKTCTIIIRALTDSDKYQ